jgi:hypothetical protein
MSNLMKIVRPIDVTIDIDETGLTFTTIGTDAVSTCHFYLMVGYLNVGRFGFLYHSDEDFPSSSNHSPTTNNSSETSDPSSVNESAKSNSSSPTNNISKTDNASPHINSFNNESATSNNLLKTENKVKLFTPMSTLTTIIDILSEDLKSFIGSKLKTKNEEFKFEMIQNLKLVIGGSVHLTPDLIYDGFILLNNQQTNNEIQQQLINPFSIYLAEHLENNVIFIKPMTYFQKESDIQNGKIKQATNLLSTLNCQINIVTQRKNEN